MLMLDLWLVIGVTVLLVLGVDLLGSFIVKTLRVEDPTGDFWLEWDD
jgi:hypothetical protein